MINSNVNDDVTNFEICRFMENTKILISKNKTQFFPLVKIFINCALMATF